MTRRTVGYVLDLCLLASVIGVVATGLIVDRFDLHEFGLHSRFGYAMTALVTVHLVLHWRPFAAFRAPRRTRAGTDRHPAGHDVPAVSSPQAGLETAHANDASPGSERPGSLETDSSDAPRPGPSRRSLLTSVAAGVSGVFGGWFARSAAAPSPYDGGDVGLFYHRESSLGLRGLLSNLLDWGRRPPRYPEPIEGETFALPPVTAPPDMSVGQAIGRRRSLRDYADRAVTVEELAWLVHTATGITSDNARRAAPSAGALYPIETYVAVNRVEGVDPGLYHVDVRAQALEQVRAGSVGGDLVFAGMGQEFLRGAPVVFVLAGYFQRTRWKYHQRHYRYVCWEAGHIAQNVYLAGEAAGLGACVVGSFLDGHLNDLLRVDGREEAALGFIAVGPRTDGTAPS